MTPRERRRALEHAVAGHPLAQWGQADSDSVLYAGHSLGCGHTELQRAVWLWTGKSVTINEISAAAGYTQLQRSRLQGMSAIQVRNVIAHYHLPYTDPQYHGSAEGIIEALRTKGPVLLAVRYEFYPQWGRDQKREAHYTGGIPTGRPNGYAIAGGRTDLGFVGGHVVTVLAARWRTDLREYRIRTCDPDHGSGARPEIPRYDIITEAQFAALVGSGRQQFGAVVAYLPTRAWTGVGK